MILQSYILVTAIASMALVAMSFLTGLARDASVSIAEKPDAPTPQRHPAAVRRQRG